MRKSILALLIVLGLVGAGCFRTDGFSPSMIQAPLSAEPALPPSSEVLRVLSQSFHYLAKGRQAFVFESADGKYVLKFFNQKYLQMPWYSFFNYKKEKAKRAIRRSYYENSYKIAQQEMGDEILYVHLGPALLPHISFTDKARHSFTLDLTHLPFVLQKKGVLFYSALDAIYEKEGLAGLNREIDSFVEAVSLRISKNIADGDHDVEHNWGYVDGHVFHLDPGRLYLADLSDLGRRNQEWYRATHNFLKWLQLHYPEGADYLKSRVAPR